MGLKRFICKVKGHYFHERYPYTAPLVGYCWCGAYKIKDSVYDPPSEKLKED